jgi:germination protein M
VRLRSLLIIAGVVLVAAVACGDDSSGPTEPSTSTIGPASTTTSTRPVVPSGTEVDVNVYFAAGEGIATAGRVVEGPAVARGALEALLGGPEGIEAEIGQVSEIPAGTDLLGIDVAAGRATVDLSGMFESGGGRLSMRLRVAQVVFTLTQFDAVDTVSFRIDGEPVDIIGGEGVHAVDVERSDFADVTPLVLVESPVPGQQVGSPLTISGTANTFEATVNYSVTDDGGSIVDEGLTTATAGNGTFGTFSVTSAFEVDRPGLGAVTGFEISARDGRQVNTYEVPVQLG